ncbi:metallophosphoesterase [Acidisarcina polymorpha]|uniref:Metallophosphoesterase n=1 Tax=Acidisarcina polymorpha TaxID=2211140 RepID=A0A2Z5G8G6_9BACT|nr:metallophosphoesterase [Acidisarcina polymorpha]AXC15004.1 metallophosphoesterase [Acidisarcina polymorpha]
MTESSLRNPSRRTFLKAGALAVGGLILYSGEVERHWIDIQHVTVKLPNLPPDFKGFRIAQLADFHYGEYSEPSFIRACIKATNALRPDLVALTGDFISAGPMVRRISAQFAYHCADLLARLECKKKFAVMGNHDAMVGIADVTDALRTRGIEVLHNSSVPVERGAARLWIAGVADILIGKQADLAAAIPKQRDRATEPLILMAHEPDYADQVRGSGVDLMLSGHTHGGQIRIPFLPLNHLPPLGEKYVEGLFRLGDLQLYVTRGIGTVEVPFRFRCPPEITLITLD